MFGYVQFAEDYFPIIATVCRSMKKAVPDIEFSGIAIKRKTICEKVDSVVSELNITSYEWWNSVEERILAAPYDEAMMYRYRERFGSEKLRFIIASDRELAPGYVTGAGTCRCEFGRLVNQSDEDRWKYVIGIIDYFTKQFEQRRPDFIFMNEITFAWEVALSLVAEGMHIPCLSLDCMRGSGSYCISEDVCGMFPQRDKLYRRSLENPELLDGYLEKAAEQVRKFRSCPVQPNYMEMHRKNFAKQTSLVGMFRRLVNDFAIFMAIKFKLYGTRGLLRQISGFDWMKLGINTYRAGRRVLRGDWFESPEPYLDKDYIFYPLHYEPESSTSVACHKMTNQVAFIEQLSKNMPFGYRLLVKEHIPSIGTRPKGFYDRIKSIPDVHLISPFENAVNLLRHAKLVTVLTGTSGWESIQLGVPTMVWGHAEYTGIGTGFRQCDKMIDFADDILAAMETPPATERELTHFLAAQYAMAPDLTYDDMCAKFESREQDRDRAEIYGGQLVQQILDVIKDYRRKFEEGEKQ